MRSVFIVLTIVMLMFTNVVRSGLPFAAQCYYDAACNSGVCTRRVQRQTTTGQFEWITTCEWDAGGNN